MFVRLILLGVCGVFKDDCNEISGGFFVKVEVPLGFYGIAIWFDRESGFVEFFVFDSIYEDFFFTMGEGGNAW